MIDEFNSVVNKYFESHLQKSRDYMILYETARILLELTAYSIFLDGIDKAISTLQALSKTKTPSKLLNKASSRLLRKFKSIILDADKANVVAIPNSWIEIDDNNDDGDEDVTSNIIQRIDHPKIALQMKRDPYCRVEVDINVSALEESIGGQIHTAFDIAFQQDACVYVDSFYLNQQLSNILGESTCHGGAIIAKVNGQSILSEGQLISFLEHMKDKVQESGIEADAIYSMTLYLPPGTDFGGVDKSKLVQGKPNPRWGGSGRPYPLQRPKREKT
jgi:hypothetical protein